MFKKIKDSFIALPKKQKIAFIFLLMVAICLGVYIYIIEWRANNLTFQSEKDTKIVREKEESLAQSPFSGIRCPGAEERAIGIILAQYPETTPLSGLSFADVVIESPVYKNGPQRLVAIFQCDEPDEVGSIRSARPYHGDLARAFDLIFVSWGRSEIPITYEKFSDIDYISAIFNPYGVFFRKANKPAPHNGFVNFKSLRSATENLGIRQENKFNGFKFNKTLPGEGIEALEISINYYFPVKFIYDSAKGSYKRYWDGKVVFDALNQKAIFAKNVVILKTQISNLQEGIADIKLTGMGEAMFYRNGRMFIGSWKRGGDNEPFQFLDSDGEEFQLAPGSTWIEIID